MLYMSMRLKNLVYPEDFEKTPERKPKEEGRRKQWITHELSLFLFYLESMIKENGGTYLCARDKPTLANCMEICAYTRGHIDFVDANCVKKSSPYVATYVQRFCALAKIEG